MATANIKINGVAASNVTLPINTLVTLDNLGTGGEMTYAWSIVTQPEGAADALSNAAIQSPTFTPKKEGTYLIRLTVNGSLVDEKLVGVLDIKTTERAPAALEKTQLDGSGLGWATAVNRWFKRLSGLTSTDFGVMVGVAIGGALTKGDVVVLQGIATLKSGLPGQETVMNVTAAGAGVAGPMGIVEGRVDGNNTVNVGELVRVRFFGLYSATLAGAPLNGDPIYVSGSSMSLASVVGESRTIGLVYGATGANYRVFVTGLFPHLAIGDSFCMRPLKTFGIWGMSGIAANTANQLMEYPVVGSAINTKAAIGSGGVQIVRRLQVDMSGNAAGAAVTFEIYKNNVATGKKVIIGIGASSNQAEFDRSLLVDSAAAIEVRASTPAGWTSTTLKAYADVVVEEVHSG